LYDGNGNVGQLVNGADGEIAAHYEYDPYGNMVNHGGVYAAGNAYRFSTKYYDTEVNLYYYGYRYYLAELGRWINRDPFEETGGKNLQTFCVNRPISLIDAFGLVYPNVA
jgi:RHS repeat-associated protein